MRSTEVESADSRIDADDKVDFGYKKVSAREKTQRVRGVFDSVAGNYDLMNDLMSFGIHRLWKRFAVNVLAPHSGDHILDAAAGTADLTRLVARRIGRAGRCMVTDINPNMLALGRDRLIDAGLIAQVDVAVANAENLPFKNETFDAVMIGFGLRNVTDKRCALAEFCRVLKPGARLVVLEFSKVVIPLLSTIYDQFSFKVLPELGKIIAGDADSYRYLAESIRRHPDQTTLKNLIYSAGFDRCEFFNLSGGIVAVHRAFKL